LQRGGEDPKRDGTGGGTNERDCAGCGHLLCLYGTSGECGIRLPDPSVAWEGDGGRGGREYNCQIPAGWLGSEGFRFSQFVAWVFDSRDGIATSNGWGFQARFLE
jgi:hypothetical protein